MKLRFRSALPPLDSSTRLPLVLAALLGAALLFQAFAVDRVDLPVGGPIGGTPVAPASLPQVAPAGGATVIVTRSMFAPPGTAAGTDAGPASALAGIAIVGSIRIGRVAYAVVEQPGSRTVYARPGERIGAWRLRALTRADAVLQRGAEQLTVPFGGQPISTPKTLSGAAR